MCTGILYYFSSTANPILYNVMSRKFREAFRRTVCCWWLPCSSCVDRAAATSAPAQQAPVAAHHDAVRPRRLLHRRPGYANHAAAVDDRSAHGELYAPRKVHVLPCLSPFCCILCCLYYLSTKFATMGDQH